LTLFVFNIFLIETTNGQVATTPVAPAVDAPPESSVSESQVLIYHHINTRNTNSTKFNINIYFFLNEEGNFLRE